MNIEFKRHALHYECIVAKFPFHKEIKSTLLSLINNTQSDFLDNGLLSDWSFRNSEERNVSYFDFFFSKAKDFYNQLFNQVFKINDQTGLVSISHNFWFQKYSENGNHPIHFHGTSDFSSVYYLDLPNNDSTVFYNQFYDNYQTVNASEGDIIIFPSIFLHTSLPSSQKTIIAINFDLK